MINTNNNLENSITSLDLGTSSIKAVVACPAMDDSQDGVYISAVGQTESKGLRKGVIINIDFTVNNIAEVVRQAEELALDNLRHCILGISGAHLEGFNSNGIVKVQYNEINARDVDRVVEAAQAVPVPLDREVLHVLIQDYVVDGQAGIKDPQGISAVRLESCVHVVTGSANCVQNMVKCTNRCGLEVDDLVLNSIASSMAVTSPEERAQGVCVVDIGAGTADLAIYYDGAIQHSAVLPLAGGLITKDLAAGLRIGVLSAEHLKCDYGVASPQQISGEQKVEVKSIGNQVSKIISQGEISSIIKMRLAEIFEHLKQEIIKSGFEHHLTAGIVLTGGTAKMQGIVSLAEDCFHMPVRIGYPQDLTGLSDFVDSPEYATSVGLIKYSQELQQESLSFYAETGFKKSYKKISNWISEHF